MASPALCMSPVAAGPRMRTLHAHAPADSALQHVHGEPTMHATLQPKHDGSGDLSVLV